MRVPGISCWGIPMIELYPRVKNAGHWQFYWIYECPGCGQQIAAAQDFTCFNCKIQCVMCNCTFVGVDRKSRCSKCADRVTCLAYTVRVASTKIRSDQFCKEGEIENR